MLSNRVQQVQSSMTMSISAKAAELRARGENVISLGAGEPDFGTPNHICEAANKAIKDGITRYTAVNGLLSLREAVVEKFLKQNALSYEVDEVIVNVGAKQSIYNICQAVLNPGDEVILPAPYWVSYPDIFKLAGAKPVIVACPEDKGFKLTASQLREVITPRTRLLLLNSPSNPTGRVYSEESLLALAEVLRDHPQILIMTDDIYEHIIFSGKKFVNIVNVAPDLKDNVIVVNGVSKAYAMTGWRIGYCAGNKEIIGAVKKIQSQSTSSPCSISQMAALAALQGPQDSVSQMRKVFSERNQLVTKELQAIDSISLDAAEGAFYLFVNISKAMQKKGFASDLDFAAQLLEKAQVAVVPGTPFGMNGYMRVSFASSLDLLQEANQRIADFVTQD